MSLNSLFAGWGSQLSYFLGYTAKSIILNTLLALKVSSTRVNTQSNRLLAAHLQKGPAIRRMNNIFSSGGFERLLKRIEL